MAGKYVINGAKIKCNLCTKPEGKLMVTSNQIGVQDKFWATEADKGTPNLLFQGNCTKFSNSPPPCAGVIAVGQWQNTAMGVKVDGKAPLLEGSSIMCMTGGVPITIADTKQKSVPTNLQSMAESGAPVPAPEETAEPEIIDAYWVDKEMNKTTIVAYGEKARIKIKTKNALNKKIKVKIYENDMRIDDFIHKYEWDLQFKETIYSFNLSSKLFSKAGEAEIELYFTLQIEDQSKETFCDSDNEYLLVDMIRYIPGIMRAQDASWEEGAKLMEKWFETPAFSWGGKAEDSSDYLNLPSDDTIISLDWVKSYKRGMDVYKEVTDLNKKIWVNIFAKRALVDLLKDEEKFNTHIDKTLFNFIKSNAHESNKYTTQYREIKSSDLSNLDGFIAALANSELRISLNGYVEPIIKHEGIDTIHKGWRITVNKVAVYLRDSYDFTDDAKKWISQPLGIWNPATNFVSGKKLDIFKGYFVNNKDYRSWRDKHQKGGDFLVFSKMETFNVFDEFTVDAKHNVIL